MRAAIQRDSGTEGGFRYFSYSGRYCGGSDGSDGAPADYSEGDTCSGIAGVNAARLRTLIDSAPGKVTLVAHSMGGLLAAYAIAADPAWALRHVASVVTFDSPLGGLDGVRKTVLGGYSLFQGGCGRGSHSMQDLDGGSEVVRAARAAGSIVPFYTLDGSGGESRAFGVTQAVPGDRTHIASEVMHVAVNEEHSEVWSRSPVAKTAAKAVLVECALMAAGSACP